MKTNHSKHSGFFERQLKITISIRRQTHRDFQLRNISLGLNNARYVFQLTIPDIFLDDSWSLRRENASVGDRGRLPLGLCRVSTSEKKNPHLTNTNTMAFTNTKTLTSQIQIRWHSQIQKNIYLTNTNVMAFTDIKAITVTTTTKSSTNAKPMKSQRCTF